MVDLCALALEKTPEEELACGIGVGDVSGKWEDEDGSKER